MICFEVQRNGEKRIVAGIGEYGVLTANLTWVAHHPEKLARWAAAGHPKSEPVEINFDVVGQSADEGSTVEVRKWVGSALAVGDEIRIRVVDVPTPDAPVHRRTGGRRPPDPKPARKAKRPKPN